MKKQTDRPGQHIDDILNSLDGLQKASPGPYFFTRLQARMQNSKTDIWDRLGLIISKPAVVAFAIACILFTNAWVLVRQMPSTQPTSTADATAEVTIADEYNMTIATVYDYENFKKP